MTATELFAGIPVADFEAARPWYKRLLHVAALAQRGLVTEPIETLGSGARKATIADPDGNRISFGVP